MQQLSDEDKLKMEFIDAFLADQFSRRVGHLDEHKLTAAFAKFIAGTKAGLMYPSVEVRGGVNLSVSAPMFDEHFEVLCTWVLEVEELYGYSVYNFTDRRFSCDFESDGTIRWDSPKKMGIVFSLQ